VAEALSDDPALAVWEDEGGRVPPGRRERAVRRDGDLTYLGLTWLKLGDQHDRAREMNHAERDRMRTRLRAVLHVGETSRMPR
jgi:hypothetical protein